MGAGIKKSPEKAITRLALNPPIFTFAKRDWVVSPAGAVADEPEAGSRRESEKEN